MFEQTFPSTDGFPAPRGMALAAAGLLEALLAAGLVAHALLAPEVLLPPVTLAFFGPAEPPPPPPAYPAAAAAMGLTGRMVLELLVDETGAVREARVVESTSPLFEAAALEAVRRWRYSRPVDARSGASVACLLTVTVHFRLR
ncbi:MAG: energy transducer TonB [Acidobacteriota bacterium]